MVGASRQLSPAQLYDSHFRELAPRYDELREDPSDELIEALVQHGDLAGRSVIDIGCGTGRVAARLAGRHGASVRAVDAAPEMVALARKRVPPAVTVTWGFAERLPFGDHSSERAVMQMVVHLVDRRAAFDEVARVLNTDGRLAISTLDPGGADCFWLAELFPSYPSIERARFPAIEVLCRELGDAGLEPLCVLPWSEHITYSRAHAMALLEGRFASSMALMSEHEYRAGLDRAKNRLPDPVRSQLDLAVIVAERRP